MGAEARTKAVRGARRRCFRLIVEFTERADRVRAPGLVPRRAEHLRPQCGHRRSPRRLRLRIDARLRRSREPHFMLQSPILAIRVGDAGGKIHRHEAELACKREQRDIAGVAGQRAMPLRVRQHEVLDGEFDVDHAARVVLQVEERRRVRMARMHLAAHCDDVIAQFQRVTRQTQNGLAFRFERSADSALPATNRARVAPDVPGPRVLALR